MSGGSAPGASQPPPLWIPFPGLKAAFLWLADNRFRLSQKYAEPRWLGVLAELQLSTWYWRLPLPQQLESLRRDNGNILSFKYLAGPDWSDGTVRAPTWDEFQRIWHDIGMTECQQVLEAWGLRSLRGGTLTAIDLQAADLKAAVFGKRLQLEVSQNRLYDRVAHLARERKRQPPQPSRLIIVHGPATVTHQGALNVKIDAEGTVPPSSAAAAEPEPPAPSATPVLTASSAAQDPQTREVNALATKLRENGLRASRTVWIAALESRFKLKSSLAATRYDDLVPKDLLTGSGNKGGGEGDKLVEAWGKEPHKL